MPDIIRPIDGNGPPVEADAVLRDEGGAAPDAGAPPADSYTKVPGGTPPTRWNEDAELRRLARQAAGNDPLKQNMREDEAFRIFWDALPLLRTNIFKPETRAEGKSIAEFDGYEEKMIQAALIRAFGARHRESGYSEFSKGDFSRGGGPFAIFSRFVGANAERLGLVGTKLIAPKAGRSASASQRGPAPQAADVLALRIPPAIASVAEVEGIVAAIPASDARRAALSPRLQEARSIRAHLLALGRDEAARTSSLRSTSVRRAAVAELEALEDIRDMATAAQVLATTDFGNPRIDQIFDAGLKAEAADWIAKHRKDIPIDEATFTRISADAFRAYVAIWLSELPAGVEAESLSYSKSARKKAELITTTHFTLPSPPVGEGWGEGETIYDSHPPLNPLPSREGKMEERAFDGLIARLTYHLVKFDASRHAEEETPPADAAESLSVPAGASGQARRMLSVEDLHSAIGSDLLERLDGFYDEIRKGSRGAVQDILPPDSNPDEYARIFYSLFLNYIRLASYEYGSNFGPQLLAANGLEPRITKSIFMRIDGASTRFDETSLNLLRRFFAIHINKANLPTAREMRPTVFERVEAREGARAAPSGGSHIEYKGTGMRAFASKIPGMDKGMQAAFALATGISWQSFLSWGEIRENPASIDIKKWEAIVENWEAIAAHAAEAGIASSHVPKTLQNLLRINCPPSMSAGLWFSQVDEANNGGRDALLALARANCPANIRADVWDAYTGWLAISGRIEDASVEPISHDSRNKVALAYDFLSDVAERHGRKLDYWDFICAIYPTARRIRASDGALRIAVPELMIELNDGNRGYMTWAQRVATRNLDTLVEPSTHSGHRRKSILPEYWNIRRYTGPIASDFEIDHEDLYAFVGGYLRWFTIIEDAIPIMDGSGNDVTSPSPDVTTRYSIRLDEDGSVKLFPGIHAKRAADRKIDIDVKNGVYDWRLKFAGSYLTAISLLDGNASVIDGDGNSTSIESLLDEYDRLAKEHEARSNILKDCGILPPEDRAGARSFYRGEFEEFMSRAIDGGEITARLPAGKGFIPFRIVRDATPFAGGGNLSLPIGDIVAHAGGALMAAGDARDTIVDMVRIRSRLIGAAAAGANIPSDTPSLKNLAAALWGGDPRSLDRAFAELVRMNGISVGLSPNAGAAPVQKAPATGGVNARSTFGPFLPARQRWEDQFEEMLRNEFHAGDDTVARATGCLAGYFREIKFIYRRFWPETLRRIAAAHASDGTEARLIYDAAIRFLPTVGLPADANNMPHIQGPGDMAQTIAAAAFDDYRDLFPRVRGVSCAIPENRELLQQIVALHIENVEGGRPDEKTTTAAAVGLLEQHNASAGDAAHSSSDAMSLPSDGLLGRMTQVHMADWQRNGGAVADPNAVRQAYFSLLPSVRRRNMPSDADIDAAVANANGGGGPNEAAFLKYLISRQMRSVDVLIAMAGSSDDGIYSLIEEPMSNPHLGNGKVALLATAYAVDRLTRNLPVDMEAIAADLVPPYIDPSSETAEWLTRQYLALLKLWLEKAEGDISNTATLAHIRLSEIASSQSSPPASIEDLRMRTAQALGIAAFAQLAAIEERANALRMLLGHGRINSMTLEDAARISFEGDTTGIRSRMEDELSAMVKRAADIQRRSAEFFAGLTVRTDIDGLGEHDTLRRIAELNRAADSSTALRKELSETSGYPRRASEIVAALSADPLAASGGAVAATELLIASARRYLDLADDRLIEELDSAEQHRDATIVQKFDSAIADVNTRRDEIDGAIRRIDGHLKDASTAVQGLEKISSHFKTPSPPVGEGWGEGALTPLPSREGKFGIFLSAKRRLDELSTKAADALDAASTEFSSLHAQVDGRRGDGAKTSSDILKDAHAVLPKLDQRLRASLEDALLALECAMDDARRIEQRINSSREVTSGASSNARESIMGAETGFPISDPAGLAEALPLPDADSYDTAFRHGTIKRDEQRAAAKDLEFLCNARVVSTPGGSYLVRKEDAARVDAWRMTDRSGPLDIAPILGERFSIEAGAYGIRTAEVRDLERDHPFSRIVRCARNLASQRTHELVLLSELSQDGGLRPMFTELLSYIASADQSSPSGDMNGTIRAWALAHMDSLDGKYFSSTGSSSPIHDSAYTREKHSKWQKVSNELLSNPHMAMASLVVDGDMENSDPIWVGPIDVRELDDFRANDFAKVRYLNSQSGNWDSANLKLHIDSNPRLKIVVSPISTEVPAMISYVRSHWTVNASADHMDLGWLIINPRVAAATGNPAQTRKYFDFVLLIRDMLEPRGITTHGEPAPLATSEIQRLAVEAYRIVKNPAASLNLRRLPAAAIASWIEGLPDRLGHLSALALHLRQNSEDDALRSYAAKLYLIARYSDDFKAETTAIATLMSHAGKLSWSATPDVQGDINRTYLKALPQIYRNMHAPLFAAPLKALSRTNPETELVRPHRLWTVMKGMEPLMGGRMMDPEYLDAVHERVSRAPGWIRGLMQWLPELARPLAIIALVHDRLPGDFQRRLLAIARDCFAESHLVDEVRKERIISEISELYRSQANPDVAGSDAIIRGLEEELSGGITVARWLSANDDTPWRSPWCSWRTMPHIKKLGLLAPEMMKARDEVKSFVADELRRRSSQFDTFRSMSNFIERFPEFASAIAVLHLVMPHLEIGNEGDTLQDRISSHFTRMCPEDAEGADEFTKAFVDMLTKPEMVDAIRQSLRRPFDESPTKTYAMELTGDDEPHLPTEIMSPQETIAYWLPDIPKPDPNRVPFANHNLVAIPAASAEPPGHTLALDIFDKGHPDFTNAVGVLLSALFICDKKMRDAIYARFSGESPITPEGFIDAIRQTRALGAMKDVLAGRGTSVEDYLISPVILEMYGDIMPEAIVDAEVNDLQMLPPKDSESFGQRIGAWQHYEVNRTTGIVRRVADRPSHVTADEWNDLVNRPERFVASYPVAYRKIATIVFEADPSKNLYLAFMEWMTAKRGDSIGTRNRHALCTEAFEFLVKNRAAILAARRILMAEREIAKLGALFPASDIGRKDLTYDYIEAQVDATGIVPPIDSPEFQRQLDLWKETEFRNFRQTIPSGASESDLRAYIDERAASAPNAYKKLSALLNISEVFRKYGDQFLGRMTDEFKTRVRRLGRNLTPDEAHRTMTLSYYELAITYRDMIIEKARQKVHEKAERPEPAGKFFPKIGMPGRGGNTGQGGAAGGSMAGGGTPGAVPPSMPPPTGAMALPIHGLSTYIGMFPGMPIPAVTPPVIFY